MIHTGEIIKRRPIPYLYTIRNLDIWVRSRNCGCLVTWFCYQLIAIPGNKTAEFSWPDPYIFQITTTTPSWFMHGNISGHTRMREYCSSNRYLPARVTGFENHDGSIVVDAAHHCETKNKWIMWSLGSFSCELSVVQALIRTIQRLWKPFWTTIY